MGKKTCYVSCFSKIYLKKIWKDLAQEVIEYWTLTQIKASFSYFIVLIESNHVPKHLLMLEVSQIAPTIPNIGTKRKLRSSDAKKKTFKKRKK